MLYYDLNSIGRKKQFTSTTFFFSSNIKNLDSGKFYNDTYLINFFGHNLSDRSINSTEIWEMLEKNFENNLATSEGQKSCTPLSDMLFASKGG